MSLSTRQVHRPDGLVIGRITRATGDDRERFAYTPLDELPDVIYAGECFGTGDASWWASWSEARATLIRWSYLASPPRYIVTMGSKVTL